MTDNDARRLAASEWFLEFSVLWAVFPLLDYLVEGRLIDLSVLALSTGIMLATGILGMLLRRGERG